MFVLNIDCSDLPDGSVILKMPLCLPLARHLKNTSLIVSFPTAPSVARIIFFILLSTSTSPLFSQSPKVRELAPGVFYYFGDETQQKSANCTWIVFKGYVLAIDANYPWGAEEILKEIRKTTTKPVRFVFNTHYHHDHTFGNSQFVDVGATVVSTEKTAEEMRTLGSYEWEHGSDYSGRSMKGFRREFPTLTFDQKLVFDDGIHRVELIRMGPAHSGGDGVAYLPKEKILVTGDLCVYGNPWGNNVADANVDYDKWLSVLETMAGWDIKIVIPGHGNPGTVETLKQQRLYLKDMLEQVRRGIKAGKTKEELIKEIDLSKHPVYGANQASTVRSIGFMYEKLSGKE
jgi:glyoxylase-like metal-dependent hydrolase (beta-lactamase superfamily II)